MDFASYLLLGLATSLHCVAMCGTLVMTYSVKGGAERSLMRRVAPHLAYQGSKVLSYMAVAVVLGGAAALVGSAVDITGFRNWVMLVAGAFMVLLGLSMTGYFPWLTRLTPRAPQWLTRVLSKNRRRAMDDSATGKVPLATPVTFGLLTGLMPCAPLIAAQAGAAANASPLTGALLMLGFGLGTAPLMIALGLVSGLVGENFRRRMQTVAAVAVLVFGLVILERGLVLVGSPVSFQAARRALAGTPAVASASPTGTGPVEVKLVIENVRFVPDTLEIPAGRPVTLVVDRREDNACSDQLAIPQLDVLVDLEPFAETRIELPPADAGTYTLTCGMGMMSGAVVVGGAAGGAGPGPLLWSAVAIALVLGAAAITVAFRRTGGAASVRAAPKASAGKKTLGTSGPTSERDATSRGTLGFTRAEAVVIAVAVVAAAVAGLAFGGLIRL